jgi:hypothetical protein
MHLLVSLPYWIGLMHGQWLFKTKHVCLLSAIKSRSQWPRGLRRGSATVCLLWLRVQIPPKARMFVCCECCVLSGRGLCNGPITPPRDSRSPIECGVSECDREASALRKPRHVRGFRATGGRRKSAIKRTCDWISKANLYACANKTL